jgi:hypothetical protein
MYHLEVTVLLSVEESLALKWKQENLGLYKGLILLLVPSYKYLRRCDNVSGWPEGPG